MYNTEKSGVTSCHTAFYIFINIGYTAKFIRLLCKDRANHAWCYCRLKRKTNTINHL